MHAIAAAVLMPADVVRARPEVIVRSETRLRGITNRCGRSRRILA